MKKLSFSQKISLLEKELAKDIFLSLQNYMSSYPKFKNEKLVHSLVIYSKIIIPSLNNKNKTEVNLALTHIKNHLCKKYIETSAKYFYKSLQEFTNLLESKKIIEEANEYDKKNEWLYDVQKNEKIQPEILDKIDCSKEERLINLLEVKFNSTTSLLAKKHLDNTSKLKKQTTALSAYNFFTSLEDFNTLKTEPLTIE